LGLEPAELVERLVERATGGPQGIRVNAVLPGAVATPMFQAASASPEAQDGLSKIHALKDRETPEELAKAILYLALDDSSFVTGTTHLVDGGISMALVKSRERSPGGDFSSPSAR